jgi:putative inorganic carbon (HCO3(-)) transporter
LRISGLWPDVNILALYFTVLFFFNLTFLVNENNNKLFYFRVISMFILAFGIFLTQTRGAWLAVVISVVIFIIKKPKIIFPTLFVIALFLILFFDVIETRYITFINFTTDASAIGRYQAWYATYLMLSENLLWGWGFDGFLYNKDAFYSGFILFLPHSHNTYLRVILEMGLIGAIFYFILFFKALIISYTFKINNNKYKFLKQYIDGLQLSFVAFLVMFMFEPFFSLYSNASIIIWTFISLSICLKEEYSTHNAVIKKK